MTTRYSIRRCATDPELVYGTTYSGQLPQYRPDPNICGVDLSQITFPDLTERDFHDYHIKCPYSIQADTHFVRNVDRNSPNYGKLEELPAAQLTDHTATNGIMIRYSRVNKWGHLCVDDDCYYHTTACSGTRYFYL